MLCKLARLTIPRTPNRKPSCKHSRPIDNTWAHALSAQLTATNPRPRLTSGRARPAESARHMARATASIPLPNRCTVIDAAMRGKWRKCWTARAHSSHTYREIKRLSVTGLGVNSAGFTATRNHVAGGTGERSHVFTSETYTASGGKGADLAPACAALCVR